MATLPTVLDVNFKELPKRDRMKDSGVTIYHQPSYPERSEGTELFVQRSAILAIDCINLHGTEIIFLLLRTNHRQTRGIAS